MRLLSALLTAALGPLAALSADPEVTITRLANLPSRLFYFDDTPVGLLWNHDMRITADQAGRTHARPRHTEGASLT